MRTSVLLFAFLTACATEPSSTGSFDTEATVDERTDLIECRTDRECPDRSYCEPGLNICFTGTRCYVEGRPSDELCERTFGRDYACFEYAADSHHCVPVEEER